MEQVSDAAVATAANFVEAVLDESARVPVLVDFWAPWCGPCRALSPILERIAADYAGRCRVAKVNTDQEQELAAHFGIRSLPTMMLFHQGQAVGQQVGVQPESVIRAMIDQYAPAASSGPLAGVHAAFARGDVDGAAELIRAGLEHHPQDPALLAELAELGLRRHDAAATADALAKLAAADPAHAQLRPLRARLGFRQAVAGHPDPSAARAALDADPANSAARHALAAHHALAEDYATALSEWLELLRRDRRYADDLARRSMLAVFDVLGEGHELIASYRRRMAALLN